MGESGRYADDSSYEFYEQELEEMQQMNKYAQEQNYNHKPINSFFKPRRVEEDRDEREKELNMTATNENGQVRPANEKLNTIDTYDLPC